MSKLVGFPYTEFSKESSINTAGIISPYNSHQLEGATDLFGKGIDNSSLHPQTPTDPSQSGVTIIEGAFFSRKQNNFLNKMKAAGDKIKANAQRAAAAFRNTPASKAPANKIKIPAPIIDPAKSIACRFEPRGYQDRYQDLKIAFHNNDTALRNHYKSNGINENRMICAGLVKPACTFNSTQYYQMYPDLQKQFVREISFLGGKIKIPDHIKLRNHYINNGINEGRAGCFVNRADQDSAKAAAANAARNAANSRNAAAARNNRNSKNTANAAAKAAADKAAAEKAAREAEAARVRAENAAKNAKTTEEAKKAADLAAKAGKAAADAKAAAARADAAKQDAARIAEANRKAAKIAADAKAAKIASDKAAADEKAANIAAAKAAAEARAVAAAKAAADAAEAKAAREKAAREKAIRDEAARIEAERQRLAAQATDTAYYNIKIKREPFDNFEQKENSQYQYTDNFTTYNNNMPTIEGLNVMDEEKTILEKIDSFNKKYAEYLKCNSAADRCGNRYGQLITNMKNELQDIKVYTDSLNIQASPLAKTSYATYNNQYGEIKNNYKEILKTRQELDMKLKELNNTKDTIKYGAKQQFDSTMYTGVLLSALATSMVYYAFVEMK